MCSAGHRQEWRRGTHECVRHDDTPILSAILRERLRASEFSALSVLVPRLEYQQDAKWLACAQAAGRYTESWIWIWNAPMPIGANRAGLGWKPGVPGLRPPNDVRLPATTPLRSWLRSEPRALEAVKESRAQGQDGSLWRAHSCAPHPDSSGCSANTRRFRGSPQGIATSGDAARMSAPATSARQLFHSFLASGFAIAPNLAVTALVHGTKAMLALPARTSESPGPGWRQEHWRMGPGARGIGAHRTWLPWISVNHLHGSTGLKDFDKALFRQLANNARNSRIDGSMR